MTTDTFRPGVTVTENRTESGSGTYDVALNGIPVGYIYFFRGTWTAKDPSQTTIGLIGGHARKDEAANALAAYRERRVK